MLVLGLDPGLASTGYGLVRGDGQKLELVAYDVIRTPANITTTERLILLRQGLLEVISAYRPEAAAVEQVFFGAHARTAMIVGQAVGVLLLTLAEAGLQIAEYTPPQVKQAITGYGRASKSQVQQMVAILLGLSDLPRPQDAADALAVSICHHHSAWLATLSRAQSRVDQ
ncbi:MAG: crossover junction endodeoxyribonuclease RuvC [Anaerolineales bacterium]|nr:MAG: crossover junction endodeoxyribonuclease RuvC [Anaerolineales bacterium]